MESVYKYIKKNINIKDTVLIAVSGGIDSMVLLDVLVNIKKEIDFNIVVAHVNHNVRKESAYEYEFVHDYCINNNVVFHGYVIKEYNEKENFHANARNIRYDFFNNLYRKYDAKFLMTAHHADDQIETILLRFIRGSNLLGYKGIKPISNMDNMTLMRPLINIEKKDIISYAEANNIKYCFDESNNKLDYTRNRIRHNIIPKLKEENNNIAGNFNEFANELVELEEFIEKYVSNLEKGFIIHDSYIIIDTISFNKHDIFIKKYLIRYILKIIYNDMINLINDVHTKKVLEFIESSKTNLNYDLPNDINVRKSYNEVIIGKYDFLPKLEYKYEIDNKVEVINPNGNNKCTIELYENYSTDNCENYILLNKDEIKFPLYVRTRTNGDKLHLYGLNKHKKISRIFIDEKVNSYLRDRWPIIVDADNKILWLPKLKKSIYCKKDNEKHNLMLKYICIDKE